MVFRRIDKSHTPIGIDIGARTVRAIQFRKHAEKTEIQAMARLPIPMAEEVQEEGELSPLAKTLRLLLASAPFIGRQVITAMPNRLINIRPLLLPSGISSEGSNEFNEAIYLAARSSLPYDIEEALLDYLPLGVEKQRNEERFAVLLVATKRNDVQTFLEGVEETGLKCMHLDVRSGASVRALHEDDSTFGVIEINPDSTTITVARGEALLFSRTVFLGGDGIVERLARTLDISRSEAEEILSVYGIGRGRPAQDNLSEVEKSGSVDPNVFPGFIYCAVKQALDQIMNEVRRSIDYFSRQRRGGAIEKVFLFGDRLPGHIAEYFTQSLGLPVVIKDPFPTVCGRNGTMPGGLLLQRSAYSVSIGLAMRTWIS